MAGDRLDGPSRRPTHRQVRAERVAQERTPGFTFVRLATRIVTWMTFCVSGWPSLSQRTRAQRRCRA